MMTILSQPRVGLAKGGGATALSAGVSVALMLCGSNANAQQEEEGTQEQRDAALEEIVITGTRVRGISGPVGSAVVGVTRAEIEASSEVSVVSLLREVPQVLNLGVTDVTRSTPGGSGNITYGNSLNIRGLGPYSTLTLVNGHRVPINARNFEPDSLAMLGIDRVEVVPDGASAVYGSDAVAGVVNLVMRRNVDGGQVMARSGHADGYHERQIGASWGTTWNAGQFFVALENSKRSNLSGDDRDFFGAGQQSNQCNPGNIVIDGVSYAIPVGGVTQADAASLQPGTENTCNATVGEDIRPEHERNNALFTFNQNVTDRIEFHAEGFYSQRDSIRLGGWPGANLNVPSTNAFFVDPTGEATSTVVQYRMDDWVNSGADVPIGTRHWQLGGGVVFDLGRDWELEVLGHYGEAPDWSRNRSNIDNGLLNAALASSDPATAFDPYGLHRTSQEVLDQIRSSMFFVDHEMVFKGGELHTGGPLFDIAGGTVRFAGGYERQDHEYSPSLARGPAGSQPECVPCNAAGISPPLTRSVDSVFGELMVPIVGSGNEAPGLRRLEVRAALRYDDYSDVGSTTNPQFGFAWGPTHELTVRGSYGTSFRAPIIPDLFGNSNAFFVENWPDPTLGGANRLGVVRSGGNPDLDPEEATTWTMGVDWAPEAVPGLSASLTYFDVDYTGQITQVLGDRVVLFREDIFAGTDIIRRGADAQQFVNAELAQGTDVFGVLPDPVELAVDGRPQNLGQTRMSGVDFQMGYAWDNPSGSYNVGLSGTHVTRYEEAQTPAAPLVSRNNSVYGPKRWRARGVMGWRGDMFGARLVMNYVGEYRNDFTAVPETVSSFTTFDLSGTVRLGAEGGSGWRDGWGVTLDVRNLFDTQPPRTTVAAYGFDPTAHDPLGRLVSASLRKSF